MPPVGLSRICNVTPIVKGSSFFPFVGNVICTSLAKLEALPTAVPQNTSVRTDFVPHHSRGGSQLAFAMAWDTVLIFTRWAKGVFPITR
jgi:hypothetical protein